jgi:hypothetical protein
VSAFFAARAKLPPGWRAGGGDWWHRGWVSTIARAHIKYDPNVQNFEWWVSADQDTGRYLSSGFATDLETALALAEEAFIVAEASLRLGA